MTAYIIRRLLLMPLILIGVTLIIFSMIWALGPDRLLASYIKSPEALKTPDAAERLIKKYGLDEPMPVQYLKWLGNILQGDFGYSMVGKKGVLPAMLERFPYTLELTIYAIIPVILVAIWLGVVSAVHQNKFIDQFIRVFALVGWSLPDFVFGLLLLLVFYSLLGWFPPGMVNTQFDLIMRSAEWNKITSMPTIDALLNGRLDIFVDALRHLILPVMTLAYLWWAYLLRITRSSMLEVLRKDYIRTARAKGVPENIVIQKHAKKNAMIPVLTVAGGSVIGLLGGTVFVETIFSRVGMGRFLADAATLLDYWSIIGGALFFSFIMVVGNLVVDVSYALVDPRIRLE
ncbi:MAG TPA: ABC transporter permease [Mesotoga infera]|uniref:Oligopeptide transport system permease protein AppB n=1 Tax=Mesotoga infera TaxID=1236046 RepID=A0A7Z7LGJ5_9BACT|nr:ABC transporter permease [Mesotoga infera]MBP8661174.1 ABC transporter permease [Mesotoga sp.]SSC13336.1 Oligopeptide transport system permease protein AppB [Mesotoga infera]HNR80085.1 ABC transporter permease [Mesotoga infera]HOI34426.1 ABC transporter permease [Mesotoga infera]HON28571.1 ABC transporter permease [Mesotoga infera]